MFFKYLREKVTCCLLLFTISPCTFAGLAVDIKDQMSDGKLCLQWVFQHRNGESSGIYEVNIPKKAHHFYLTKSPYIKVHGRSHIENDRSFIIFLNDKGTLTEYIIEYKGRSISCKQSVRIIEKSDRYLFESLPEQKKSLPDYKKLQQFGYEGIGSMYVLNFEMRHVRTRKTFEKLALILDERKVEDGKY